MKIVSKKIIFLQILLFALLAFSLSFGMNPHNVPLLKFLKKTPAKKKTMEANVFEVCINQKYLQKPRIHKKKEEEYINIDLKALENALSIQYTQSDDQDIRFSIFDYLKRIGEIENKSPFSTDNIFRSLYSQTNYFSNPFFSSFYVNGIQSDDVASKKIIRSEFFIALLQFCRNKLNQELKENGCKCTQSFLDMVDAFSLDLSQRTITIHLMTTNYSNNVFFYPNTVNFENWNKKNNNSNKNNEDLDTKEMFFIKISLKISLQPFSWLPNLEEDKDQYKKLIRICEHNQWSFYNIFFSSKYTKLKEEIGDHFASNGFLKNLTETFFLQNKDLHKRWHTISNYFTTVKFVNINRDRLQKITTAQSSSPFCYFLNPIITLLANRRLKKGTVISATNVDNMTDDYDLHYEGNETNNFLIITNFFLKLIAIAIPKDISNLTKNHVVIHYSPGNEFKLLSFVNEIFLSRLSTQNRYTTKLVEEKFIKPFSTDPNFSFFIDSILSGIQFYVNRLLKIDYNQKFLTMHIFDPFLAQPIGNFGECCKISMEKEINFTATISAAYQSEDASDTLAKNFFYYALQEKNFKENCTDNTGDATKIFDKYFLSIKNDGKYSPFFRDIFGSLIKSFFKVLREKYTNIGESLATTLCEKIQNIFDSYNCIFIMPGTSRSFTLINCDPQILLSKYPTPYTLLEKFELWNRGSSNALFRAIMGTIAHENTKSFTTMTYPFCTYQTLYLQHHITNRNYLILLNKLSNTIVYNIPKKTLQEDPLYNSEYNRALNALITLNDEYKYTSDQYNMQMLPFILNFLLQNFIKNKNRFKRYYLSPFVKNKIQYAEFKNNFSHFLSKLTKLENIFKNGSNSLKEFLFSIKRENESLPYENFFTDLKFAFSLLEKHFLIKDFIKSLKELEEKFAPQNDNILNVITDEMPCGIFIEYKGRKAVKDVSLNNKNIKKILESQLQNER